MAGGGGASEEKLARFFKMARGGGDFIIKENNSILFKTLVGFLIANYCMRKLSQVYFKGVLYSSCNILHLILLFLSKTPSKT